MLDVLAFLSKLKNLELHQGRRSGFQTGGGCSLRLGVSSGNNSEVCYFMKKWGPVLSSPHRFRRPCARKSRKPYPFCHKMCERRLKAVLKCVIMVWSKHHNKELRFPPTCSHYLLLMKISCICSINIQAIDPIYSKVISHLIAYNLDIILFRSSVVKPVSVGFLVLIKLVE